MSENRPERDPRSRFEDEGIPDHQAGTPGQQWAEDPQEDAVPGDVPTAVDEFGTTRREQIEGESLDARQAREVPEEQVAYGDGPLDDDTRRAGRLVAPDAGGGVDAEPDAVGSEIGPDMGGYTAEEEAMRVEPEEPVEPEGTEAADPDAGSGRTEAGDGGYLPGEGTGRPHD